MPKEVFIHTKANEELKDAVRWYEKQQAGLGNRFLLRIKMFATPSSKTRTTILSGKMISGAGKSPNFLTPFSMSFFQKSKSSIFAPYTMEKGGHRFVLENYNPKIFLWVFNGK
jgi:hypothetical protein